MGDPNETFPPAALETDAANARAAIDAAGQAAPKLIEAWVAGRNAAAVAAIAADETAPAAARKAAKRALQVLRSRGVSIPARPRAALAIAPAKPVVEAWYWGPDPTGTSLFTFAAHEPAGRFEVKSIVVRDRVGVVQVQGFQLSGSQLRARLASSASQTGVAPASVPVAWARWRVARARDENARSGAILPLGLDSAAELLEPVPTEPPPHPLEAAGLPPVDAAATVLRSAELHRLPELGAWVPDARGIQDLLVALGKRVGASGAPEPARMEEFLGEEIDAATDRWFSPELRAIVADRMRDAAITVRAREGGEPAAEVVAVAHAVRSLDAASSPPHTIPFLRAFFQKALAFVASRNQGQIPIPVPEGTQGAIVSPAEAAQQKALAGERVSPGGIILPR